MDNYSAGKRARTKPIKNPAPTKRRKETETKEEPAKPSASNIGSSKNKSVEQTEIISKSTEISDLPFRFDIVPLEIFGLIVSTIPVRQWPTLERINRHFQRAVLIAWRDLRNGSLETFVDVEALDRKNNKERKEKLASLFRTLVNRSPKIESLSGFSSFISTLNIRSVRSMIQFQNLKRVDFSECLVPLRHIAEFLSTSNSRGRLEELNLYSSMGTSKPGVFRFKERHGNDPILAPALVDIPGRPALKLKKFVYERNDWLRGAFLESLDVSELQVLSFADSYLRPTHLVNFLGRCARLRQLNLDNLRFGSDEGVPSYKVVIQALGSLPSVDLQSLSYNCLTGPYVYRPLGRDLATAFSQLGRRCQRLQKIVLATNFQCSNFALCAIADNFTSLTCLRLDIRSCDSWVIVRLLALVRKLEILELKATSSLAIDYAVIKAIVTHQTQLVELCLDLPAALSRDLEDLCELKNLKKLRIGGQYVTNRTVIKWFKNFDDLEMFWLYKVPKISDTSIIVAVKKLTKVRFLSLEGAAITDVSLRAIAASCPLLETLNISRCAKTTVAGARVVYDSCRELTKFHLPPKVQSIIVIDQPLLQRIFLEGNCDW